MIRAIQKNEGNICIGGECQGNSNGEEGGRILSCSADSWIDCLFFY